MIQCCDQELQSRSPLAAASAESCSLKTERNSLGRRARNETSRRRGGVGVKNSWVRNEPTCQNGSRGGNCRDMRGLRSGARRVVVSGGLNVKPTSQAARTFNLLAPTCARESRRLPQDRQLDGPPLAVAGSGSSRRAGVDDLPRAAALAAVAGQQGQPHLHLVLDCLLRQAGVEAQALAGGGFGAALLAQLAVPDIAGTLGLYDGDGEQVPIDFDVAVGADEVVAHAHSAGHRLLGGLLLAEVLVPAAQQQLVVQDRRAGPLHADQLVGDLHQLGY